MNNLIQVTNILLLWARTLRRNGVAHGIQKLEMQYLSAISKNNRMLSVCFQGKRFKITVIQVYAQTTDAEEAEFEWFY